MPDDMPTWVSVWFWLRFLRAKQEMSPLPQQGINPQAMTMDEYESFEYEWEQSGRPTVSAAQIVRAMTGQPLEVDEEIPF